MIVGRVGSRSPQTMARIDFTPEEGAELEKLQQELMAANQRTAKTLQTNGVRLTGSFSDS